MRRVLLLAVVVLAGVAPPAGAARPHLSATPNPARFGEVVTVSGRGWPVIEFCARRVRLALRSAQNELVLGFARVRASGRFTFRWTPRRSEVGAGAWRAVARLRCESGDDGSPVFVRRSVPLRLEPGYADGRTPTVDRRPLRSLEGMPVLKRFARYLKHEMWRPDDPRIHVRKRRPGFGWTINLAAVRDRLKRR